jgi:hypothetical protein
VTMNDYRPGFLYFLLFVWRFYGGNGSLFS